MSMVSGLDRAEGAGAAESASPANEELPSAKQIGREFVRQYYTMLATECRHVHRFYSHDSTFSHGEAEPVKGQAGIQRQIASLAIKTCSAKILKVDSAPTLGNGVVIQVIGLLNINGGGYERFLQTFVLAPQSAKNYYVYNDIFRYDHELHGHGEALNDPAAGEAQANLPNGSAHGPPRHNGNAAAANAQHPPAPAQDLKADSPDSVEPGPSPTEADQAVWASAAVAAAAAPTPLIPRNQPLLNHPPPPQRPESYGGGGRNVGVAPPMRAEAAAAAAEAEEAAESRPVVQAPAQPQQPPPSDPSPAPPTATAATTAQPAPDHPPVPTDSVPSSAVKKSWATVTKQNTGNMAPAVVTTTPVAVAAVPPNQAAPASGQAEAPPTAAAVAQEVSNGGEAEEAGSRGGVPQSPPGFVPKEIFVSQVPPDVKEQILEDYFNACLGGVGKVEMVRIRKPASGSSTGAQIAFINLTCHEGVEALLKDQKSPAERLPFQLPYGGGSVEVTVTRVREQKGGGTGMGRGGGRGGGGAVRGGLGRGGGGNYTAGGPPFRGQPPTQGSANRRQQPGYNPRPQ